MAFLLPIVGYLGIRALFWLWKTCVRNRNCDLNIKLIEEINTYNGLSFPLLEGQSSVQCEKQGLRLTLRHRGLTLACENSPFLMPKVHAGIKKGGLFSKAVEVEPFYYHFQGYVSPAEVERALKMVLETDPRQSALQWLGQSVQSQCARILEFLYTYYRGDEEVREAARTCLSRRDSNSLIAARILGRDAIPFLRDLIEKSAHSEPDALATLGSIDDPATCEALLQIVSGPHGHKVLLPNLVQALSGRADDRFIAPLTALTESGFQRTNTGKWIVAEILVEIGTGATTPFLIRCLDRDTPMLPTLVRTLAKCGDFRAVAPLKRLLTSQSSYKLRNEVIAAVFSIQSRLGDVEYGWLTVADTGLERVLTHEVERDTSNLSLAN